MLSKNTTYISRLDHLRFFAALLVLLYHFHGSAIPDGTINPFLIVVKNGESGVGLFMVLSGFILTRISVGKQIDYKSFITNRILRIYPLYLLMLLVAAYSGGRHMDILSMLALVLPIGVVAGVTLPKFPHIWTIAVEFQFYLAFPFVVRFLHRYGIRYLIGVIALAISIRTMMYLTDGSIQDGSYWTILGRLDQFVIGMITAVAYEHRRKLFASPLVLLVSIAAVCLWVFAFGRWTGGFYGKDSASSVAWIISPTAEAMLWALLSISYLQQQWKVPVIFDKTFAYLGSISFSIYMWHYQILGLLGQYHETLIFQNWYFNLIFIALPVVLAVSSLSYFVVERPFFALRTKYAIDGAGGDTTVKGIREATPDPRQTLSVAVMDRRQPRPVSVDET